MADGVEIELSDKNCNLLLLRDPYGVDIGHGAACAGLCNVRRTAEGSEGASC